MRPSTRYLPRRKNKDLKINAAAQRLVMLMAKKTSPEPAKKAPKKEISKAITRKTIIGDAARSSAEAAEIMFSHGLHCIGCGMTAFESIEEGCAGHGLDDKKIDSLVDELNKAVEKIKK
jgi:hybrid cluster-associated redox disulfide protein